MELYRHFQDGATRITSKTIDGAIPLSDDEQTAFLSGYQQEATLQPDYIIRTVELQGFDPIYIKGLVLRGKLADFIHDEQIRYDSLLARDFLEKLLNMQWRFISQVDEWKGRE